MAARARRIALGLWITALASCIQDDGTRFNPFRQLSPFVSEEQERELGLDFDRTLLESAPVVDDPVVTGFLSDLGQAIVDQVEPQPFVYRFRIVEDPSLNAFAVPGGFVYFHSGTVLAAGDIHELAGVMGHEIAHVKAHHYAKMREQQAIPDLATQLIGLGAAIAAKDAAPMVIAQGINVSMQLKYSRELETEADELGAVWTARAGFEPAGIVPFFRRLLRLQASHPGEIPPYLFSHPAVDERILSAEQRAADLRPRPQPESDWNERLRRVQARLAMLLDLGRGSLPTFAPPPDTRITDPLLADAEQRLARGQVDAALLVLARAEAREPNDPRVPLRIGELLLESEREAQAVRPLRRAVQLAPSRPLVFYRLGEAYRAVGDRHRSVWAFEQARTRAGQGELRERSDWQIQKLTFWVVEDSGFHDASSEGDEMPPPSRGEFRAGEPRIAWWARLGPRFVPYIDRIKVRWRAPDGDIVQEMPAERYRKPFVGAVLERDRLEPGPWTVEARLDDERIHRETIVVGP